MTETDLLVVGPATRSTGGISRYVSEQRARLPDSIAVRVYDDGTGSAVWPLWRRLLVTLWAMLRFPFRRRPDVVHVHTSQALSFYRATWYVVVAALCWRRPVLVHVHGSNFDEFVATESRVVRAVQRVTFGLVTRVIVLSDGWQTVLAERVESEKLTVLPNAVDPTEYDPEYDPTPPVVAFVSNHIDRKGIRELVTAVERVDADLGVRLAGTGPLSALAERLAAEHDHVEYLGYTSEAEKRRLLDSATLYALPTHAEGLPIALLEGMAGGNAVVTTDVGAIPEVVDEDSGWLIEPGDVEALASVLRTVDADPQRAAEMGRHNRALVEQQYAWSVVVDRLTDLYRSLHDASGQSR